MQKGQEKIEIIESGKMLFENWKYIFFMRESNQIEMETINMNSQSTNDKNNQEDNHITYLNKNNQIEQFFHDEEFIKGFKLHDPQGILEYVIYNFK
ncbi:MAG: hypothetical protein ACK56I_37300, partial [bacterium]